jgi:hypothetical protein
MKVVAFSFLDRPPIFTPLEALAVCKLMVKNDPATCPHGKKVHRGCGHFTACNYGFGALGFNFAADAWRGAPKKLKHHGLDKMVQAPAGALVFWTGGSAPDHAGHVGIADGKGNIFGTDLPDTNHFGRFPIDQVTDRFTEAVPAGWTFPFFPAASNDNRHPPKLPNSHEDTAHQRITKKLIEDAQDTIAAAKRGLTHDPSPELEAAYHRAITEAKQQIARIRGLVVG